MVEVTKSATNQIAEYFKGKEVSPIRIFLNDGGWGGPSLAMALDEQKTEDHFYEVDGFQYIVNKDFMTKAQPIRIDYNNYGFRLDSSYDFGVAASACSSCGTSTGGCGA